MTCYKIEFGVDICGNNNRIWNRREMYMPKLRGDNEKITWCINPPIYLSKMWLFHWENRSKSWLWYDMSKLQSAIRRQRMSLLRLRPRIRLRLNKLLREGGKGGKKLMGRFLSFNYKKKRFYIRLTLLISLSVWISFIFTMLSEIV